MGTTGLGFFTPFVVFMLTVGATLVFILWAQGKDAMRLHWRQTAAVTSAVTLSVMLVVYGPIFLWNVVKTVYGDHGNLVLQNSGLKEQNDKLAIKNGEVDSKNKQLEDENKTLKGKGGKERIVKVEGPCKLTAEQINPARFPQPCPGSPPPTLRDRVLAINTHLTENDRNRFSNALAEFSDSLSYGENLAYKLNGELGSLSNAERDGTIAKEVQAHEKILTSISAEGWKYQKAFPALRTKWDMFREQNEYIFGDNPDNEGPNAIINGADAYRNYLEWWNVIPNKDQKPVLNLLSVEHNESQGFLTTFFKWQRGCVARLNEMRNSIR
jgi:hypothetical protein